MNWLHMHYSSQTLGMPVSMEVLLPGHRVMTKSNHSYKTLYLLHGMGEDHTTWLRNTCLERYAEGLPLAVVMPNCHLSWYTDMKFGKDYFKFISMELPSICERMFPISSARKDRFIAGISMGGYGAMKAGLCAPEQFGAAASFSGALDINQIYDNLNVHLAMDVFGMKEDLQGSNSNLFTDIDRLLQSGNTPSRLYLYFSKEDKYYDTNIKFVDYAGKKGVNIACQESPEGRQWKYWDNCIAHLLPRLIPNQAIGEER